MDKLSLERRLEEINKLRQQALADQRFISSAQEHEDFILEAESREYSRPCNRRNKTAKKNRLSDIYSESVDDGHSGYC